MIETVESGDADEGNAVGGESQNAETKNPLVDDQGNAVGESGSTAETMNPVEEEQGISVGNGKPIADGYNPQTQFLILAVPSNQRSCVENSAPFHYICHKICLHAWFHICASLV